uniref:C2H2-type domain-containing protein n=1 Tax=Photinus pyralis TaxID=7054 RepID=A0A1Y1LS70_PHOPY
MQSSLMISFPETSKYCLAIENDATLRALLSIPVDGQFKKEVGSSLRKFQIISDQIIRPGYSKESQFACRHCGKSYRWKSTMRRHELVECGDKEPSFECPKCPYKAKQKGNLGVHMRKHHHEEKQKQ